MCLDNVIERVDDSNDFLFVYMMIWCLNNFYYETCRGLCWNDDWNLVCVWYAKFLRIGECCVFDKMHWNFLKLVNVACVRYEMDWNLWRLVDVA